MNYRSIHDIFASTYLDTPDENNVRKVVDMYMDQAMEMQSLQELYDWLMRVSCPYMREAYAVTLHYRLQERNADRDDPWKVNQQYYEEQIEPVMRRIIRCSHSDQIALEMMERTQPAVWDNEEPQSTSAVEKRVTRLEQQVQFLTNEWMKAHHTPTSGAYCSYILHSDIKSEEEIESAMRQAASGKASELAAYIDRARKLHYIDTLGHSKKQIFDTLNAHFHLAYTYDNWKKAAVSYSW